MATKRQGVSPWLKFGLPVFVVITVAAVLGGVLGSRAANNNSSEDAAAASSSAEAAASSAASAAQEAGRFATATDSDWMVPIYPSTTNSAAFTSPTFQASSNLAWPEDPFQPSGEPSPTTVRPDRPRLIAPAYKWALLPQLIPQDPYLTGWNDTIFGNASAYAALPAVQYFMDGESGILDNAREIKLRIKIFAYAYRMTNVTQWSDLAWREIENAMSPDFGPEEDKWNTGHFLDPAEFAAGFAIGYDWLYGVLSDDQKSQMREALLRYALRPGLSVHTDPSVPFGWWRTDVRGNWNCVCNNGLTMASLAILGDDDSGVAEELLGLTIDNAKSNCAEAVTSDGTWAETPDYWYFGTTSHAEMASSLISATGSDYGLLDVNEDFQKTGDFHMHVFGPTSMFNWGDHGPNKFSATANCMFLYSSHYSIPRYALFQREQSDAAEPWSMFWYDPSVSGAFWVDMPLDGFFDDANDQWVAMRSSWTDQNALYVAMKAGESQDHQAHNDLDVGDFVLDALGTRWAGEYGSGDYLSAEYFSSEAQDATRWLYFRKGTQGQNTIMINGANQDVGAAPSVRHESSGTTQTGSTTVFSVPDDSNAFWTTDMTSAYSDTSSMKRGVRVINKRRQVLIQDEIDTSGTIQWRMHTNATVSTSGTSATLERDGQTMTVSILNAPSGAAFSTAEAVNPSPEEGIIDQPNPGITILEINLEAGQYTLEVLFNPQWDGMSSSDYVTPPSVALDDWSLTSHD